MVSMDEISNNSRDDLAWAAGFIDGEGYFRFQPIKSKGKQRAYGCASLNVAQTAERKDVLERLQKALKGYGTIYGPYRHKNGRQKPYYVFMVLKFTEFKDIVDTIYRWLSQHKQLQASVALQKAEEYKARPPLKRGPKSGYKEGSK